MTIQEHKDLKFTGVTKIKRKRIWTAFMITRRRYILIAVAASFTELYTWKHSRAWTNRDDLQFLNLWTHPYLKRLYRDGPEIGASSIYTCIHTCLFMDHNVREYPYIRQSTQTRPTDIDTSYAYLLPRLLRKQVRRFRHVIPAINYVSLACYLPSHTSATITARAQWPVGSCKLAQTLPPMSPVIIKNKIRALHKQSA